MRLNKPPKVCPVERWSSAHTTLHSGHTRILIFNVLIQLLNHGLPVLLWQCGVMAFWPSPSSTWRLCWAFYWSPSPKSLISPKSWPTLLAWPSEHSSPTPCFSLYQRCVRDERFNQTDEAQYCVLHSKVFFLFYRQALGFDPKSDNYVHNAVGIFGGFYILYFVEKVLKLALRMDHEVVSWRREVIRILVVDCLIMISLWHSYQTAADNQSWCSHCHTAALYNSQ